MTTGGVGSAPLRWLMLATHVPSTGAGGGMVRYCVELARALERHPGVELHVLCDAAARPFFVDMVGADRAHPAPAVPKTARSLVERLGGAGLPRSGEEWDVVHGAKHLVPRAAGSARRLLTVHDMSLLDRPADFGTLKRFALRGPYLASIADADKLVCVSEATRQRLCSWAPDVADRAHVVGLASSPTLQGVVPVPVRELEGRPFVVVVGDPSPRKNVSMVVNLWPRVVAAHPGAVLAVVGPPSWGRSELGETAALLEAGSLALLGHRSDAELSWLYEHAAALVCPSQLEGFGLPVVEAEARGVPVIVSDDAALGEAGGQATTRLSLHDSSGWHQALSAALSRPLGARRPPPAVRSWADVAAETVEVARGR
jgi:glycosyltransferase involved in cell wall biosynthesis